MKDKIVFQIVLNNFQIIPYTRMTGRGKFSPRARRYLENQEALAWEFRKVWKDKPSIAYPVILSWSVHLPHRRRVDADNVGKAIQDALEKAGVIENDRWIRGTDRTRLWQDGQKRVIVILRGVKEDG